MIVACRMWVVGSASASGSVAISCPMAGQGTELAGAAAAGACAVTACAIRPMRKAIAIRFIFVFPFASHDDVDRAGFIAVARVRDTGTCRVRDQVGVRRLPRVGREGLGWCDVDDDGVVVFRLVVPRHEVALLRLQRRAGCYAENVGIELHSAAPTGGDDVDGPRLTSHVLPP